MKKRHAMTEWIPNKYLVSRDLLVQFCDLKILIKVGRVYRVYMGEFRLSVCGFGKKMVRSRCPRGSLIHSPSGTTFKKKNRRRAATTPRPRSAAPPALLPLCHRARSHPTLLRHAMPPSTSPVVEGETREACTYAPIQAHMSVGRGGLRAAPH